MFDKPKDFYNNLSGRERVLFFSSVIAILFMILDLVVLGPVLEHMRGMDQTILSTSQSIQRDLRILSFKESILREYEQHEHFMDSGEKSQEEIIAILLRRIENYATQHNIKMINILPGEIEDKPIYQIYKTTLDFEGSLPDVLLFMNLLEESDGLFQVTRYDFRPKSKSGAVLKANMDVSRILITAEIMGGGMEKGEEFSEDFSDDFSEDTEMPFEDEPEPDSATFDF